MHDFLSQGSCTAFFHQIIRSISRILQPGRTIIVVSIPDEHFHLVRFIIKSCQALGHFAVFIKNIQNLLRWFFIDV